MGKVEGRIRSWRKNWSRGKRRRKRKNVHRRPANLHHLPPWWIARRQGNRLCKSYWLSSLYPNVVNCYQRCSRAWTEVDGVHSLLCLKWSVMCMYVLCTFVTLRKSGVHPLLMASTHFFLGLHPCLLPDPEILSMRVICQRSKVTVAWFQSCALTNDQSLVTLSA